MRIRLLKDLDDTPERSVFKQLKKGAELVAERTSFGASVQVLDYSKGINTDVPIPSEYFEEITEDPWIKVKLVKDVKYWDGSVLQKGEEILVGLREHGAYFGLTKLDDADYMWVNPTKEQKARISAYYETKKEKERTTLAATATGPDVATITHQQTLTIPCGVKKIVLVFEE